MLGLRVPWAPCTSTRPHLRTHARARAPAVLSASVQAMRRRQSTERATQKATVPGRAILLSWPRGGRVAGRALRSASHPCLCPGARDRDGDGRGTKTDSPAPTPPPEARTQSRVFARSAALQASGFVVSWYTARDTCGPAPDRRGARQANTCRCIYITCHTAALTRGLRHEVWCTVFSISRDWSRAGIKSCNPKNQLWDLSRNKWYLSQPGCGIKSGMNTPYLPHFLHATHQWLERVTLYVWLALGRIHASFERGLCSLLCYDFSASILYFLMP